MTDAEIQAWSTIYAAVLHGLLAQPQSRHSWEAMRQRASLEATAAINDIR